MSFIVLLSLSPPSLSLSLSLSLSQGQICKQPALCLNFYPSVIKYHQSIIPLSLSVSKKKGLERGLVSVIMGCL